MFFHIGFYITLYVLHFTLLNGKYGDFYRCKETDAKTQASPQDRKPLEKSKILTRSQTTLEGYTGLLPL